MTDSPQDDREKRCRACGEVKSLDQFYRNSKGAEGRVARCIPCQRSHAKPLNAAHRKRHASEEAARTRRYRMEDRQRAQAHDWFSNALRDGRITRPEACEACGGTDSRIEGHHPDYAEPQRVDWLCRSCHWKEHHAAA